MNSNVDSGQKFVFHFLAVVCFMTTLSAGAQVSNVKGDEFVQFFRTSAWFESADQCWNIPIHAWVYEPQDSHARKTIVANTLRTTYNLTASESNQGYFDQRVNLLLADNERGKRLIVRIGEQIIALPKTDARGHTQTVFRVNAGNLQAAVLEKGIIEYELVMPEDDDRKFKGQSMLIAEQGISLISDIDDTVKITHVTDRQKLLNQTFYQAFEAVQGMADLYRMLNDREVSMHFVSSSPWHLYQPLDDFFSKNNFPVSSVSLKTIRFKDSSILNLFKSGEETKPLQIAPLLQRYPKRTFILIGDSGEQDPEVYQKMYQDFPDRIIAIFIRNVNEQSDSDDRYQDIKKIVGTERFLLFEKPQEVYIRLQEINIL